MSTQKDNEAGGDINFETMTLVQARKYASLYRIPVDKDMEKEDIIASIKNKMKSKDIAVVADTGEHPAPGWARIELHRNAMPGNQNRPVYVSINGYRITIPRGIPVDVPIKITKVLNDAKDFQLVENIDEPMNSPKRYTRQAVLSYPYQLLDITPGPDPRPGYERSKLAHYGPREKFMKLFGRWPKRYELLEARKEGFIKLDANESLPNAEFISKENN